MAKLMVRGGRLVDPRNGHGRRGGPDFRGRAGRRGRAGAGGAEGRPGHRRDRPAGHARDWWTATPTSAAHDWPGHAMMARVGVTTALNLSGEVGDVLDGIKALGAGLTIASLDSPIPGRELPGPEPTAAEIGRVLDRSLDQGAIGVKVLGGHYPYTPEATAAIFRAARERTAYAAFHVGSTSQRQRPARPARGRRARRGRPAPRRARQLVLPGHDPGRDRRGSRGGRDPGPQPESALRVVPGAAERDVGALRRRRPGQRHGPQLPDHGRLRGQRGRPRKGDARRLLLRAGRQRRREHAAVWRGGPRPVPRDGHQRRDLVPGERPDQPVHPGHGPPPGRAVRRGRPLDGRRRHPAQPDRRSRPGDRGAGRPDAERVRPQGLSWRRPG